ncbi:hypothetical protein LHJ74_31905 [Streptomyces sp. N2-109]|uniref:Uncharacterized protein n=1 Tax=Streptomyces gossypii TaxID=2883101 RepID=A0ABT2K4N3_9ACTN|nr:hypothetical protein [Streptomyces gossypii]MCT2594460.1 hypothetical protein [Streptomyces gossypii]
MKKGTIKTLGITALGAVFAVAGSGAASAAGLTDTVQGASGSGALGQLAGGPASLLPEGAPAAGQQGSGMSGNLSSDNATALLGGMPAMGQQTGSGGGTAPSGGMNFGGMDLGGMTPGGGGVAPGGMPIG